MATSVKTPSKMPMPNRLDALRLQLVATEMSLRVGTRIRQRREELGIRTQRELADLIPVASVTNQTVNKWEKGANEPSARYKALLAEALQVDVAYFIAEDPKPPTPNPFPSNGSLGDLVAGLADQLAQDRDDRGTNIADMKRVIAAQADAIDEQSRALREQAAVLGELRDAVRELRETVATQQTTARHLEEMTQAAVDAMPVPAASRARRKAPTGTSRGS